jgi:hypothetical protein
MGESPEEFHAENESLICLDVAKPLTHLKGSERGVVERTVQFNKIEEPAVEFKLAESPLLRCRIEETVERRKIPSSHANKRTLRRDSSGHDLPKMPGCDKAWNHYLAAEA